MNYNKIINCCRDLLLNSPEAKYISNYLDKRLNQSAQDKFSFGYFPSNENLHLILSIIKEEEISDIIFEKTIYDTTCRKIKCSSMQDHNLIMPYRDVYGNIIAIVGRSILGDEERKTLNISKYKNTSFSKGSHLFGLYEAKISILKNNLAVIVEGQFDCISAHAKGQHNVVALGSSNMTFEQFALLNRYTNNIILLLDSDIAGKTGSEKILRKFGKYANIKIATLPDSFKDLDEYLCDNDFGSLSFNLK